jgi:hypothetical protein
MFGRTHSQCCVSQPAPDFGARPTTICLILPPSEVLPMANTYSAPSGPNCGCTLCVTRPRTLPGSFVDGRTKGPRGSADTALLASQVV